MNDDPTSKPRLRVLLIEDSEDDAFLLLRTLRQGGYDLVSQRIDTAPALRAALDEAWDIVFCDYVMPEFSGPAAVALIRARDPDVPVIMVSGEVREEVLVTAMKAGANDYVLKDRLGRLLPVVERERSEAEARVARRRAEAELRRSQELWRQLFEQSPVGLVVTDAAGQVTNLNPTALAMLGSPGEAASRRINVLSLPTLRPRKLHEAYARVLGGGDPERAEGLYRSAYGREAQIDFHLVPLMDSDGAVIGTLSILQDLTERRRVEGALRQSERALEASRLVQEELVNSIDGILWEADAQAFTFSFVSPQAERILGYARQQWLDGPGFWPSLIHPDDRDRAVAFCQEAIRALQDHAFEYRIRHADGRYLWLRDIVTVIAHDGVPVRLRGLMIDITAQKAAEAAQRSSQERFRALIESSGEMLGLVDVGGRALYVSGGSRHVVGREPQALVGSLFSDHIHPDDLALADLGELLAQPGVTLIRRLRLRHADGSWRWVEGSARNLLDHPDVAAIVLNARLLPPES
ncbi:MAG: PAS domain S-box protein [Candidatus Binatia bacterium]